MIFNDNDILAVKELLYKIADDQLIIGHRNSEWTGLGPILEEDIAFSSMAQDKIGQASTLFQILENLGEGDPDQIAFNRSLEQYKCCHLVQYPIGEYEFSLMRQFLFDHAEQIRFDMLSHSSFEPLALLARKFRGEIKYHVLHANTWIKQLSQATEESNSKMQTALNQAFPLAMGIFEEGPYEDHIKDRGIFNGEKELKKLWLSKISDILKMADLRLPSIQDDSGLGGRIGEHSPYLKDLVDEMTEVFSIDPEADW